MATPKHRKSQLPRYLRISQDFADAIVRGRYQAGDLLPSEAQVRERYGVSNNTVRLAFADLRAMGLVHSRQGKGTMVRPRNRPAACDRSIERAGREWSLPFIPEDQAPALSRILLDGPVAELLQQPGRAAVQVDRIVRDAHTGTRMVHKTTIPLSVTAEVPAIAETPDLPLPDLYRQLSEAGHTLTFHDVVTARQPWPDECASLDLQDVGPVITVYRVARGRDARPLLCEELITSADRSSLIYPVTPTDRSAP